MRLRIHGQALKDKRCDVTGSRPVSSARGQPDWRASFSAIWTQSGFPLDAGSFDYVLMLDVIEHLRSPERFVDSLRSSRAANRSDTLIVSTGNVAFLVTRLMLLFGWFNYGSRGILDLTHTRLFTFATIRKLFEQSGYRIEEIRGIPAPFPLAFGDTGARPIPG